MQGASEQHLRFSPSSDHSLIPTQNLYYPFILLFITTSRFKNEPLTGFHHEMYRLLYECWRVKVCLCKGCQAWPRLLSAPRGMRDVYCTH